MNDRDEMQARAETAPKTKPSGLPLEAVVIRALRDDGHGLTPREVMTLVNAIIEANVDHIRLHIPHKETP